MSPGFIVSMVTLAVLLFALVRKDYRYTAIGFFLLFINMIQTFTDPWWTRPI